MKLEDKVKELEGRIKQLESRPIYIPYPIYSPPVVELPIDRYPEIKYTSAEEYGRSFTFTLEEIDDYKES